MKLLLWCFTALLAATGNPLLARPTAETAPTQHVAVDGDRVAYRRIGSGSPLLLANRMRGTLDTWDPLFLNALAERHSVITFDYPGIGYSTGALPDDPAKVAHFVDRFATALKLDRFAMAGWSWGGLATQSLLTEKPGRLTHAILIATNPPGPLQIPIRPLFIERAFKPVNDLDDEYILFFEPRSEFSRAAARASHDRIYARPDVVSKIPATMEQIQVYLDVAKAFGEDAAGRRAALTRSELPILIICGDNDISTAGQNWLPLLGQMKKAQFHFYSETGHGPQHQYPQLTADYIADFIARVTK
jgi:pimeloyl-ACP methyl ester carboxylesterase